VTAEASIQDSNGLDEGEGSTSCGATARCRVCDAPPPRRGSFGLIACAHQLAGSVDHLGAFESSVGAR
jgi:hypothetical protein